MVKRKIIIVLMALLMMVFTACSPPDQAEKSDEDQIRITVSFSILADIVKNVAGDKAEVDHIVPNGGDPHEYEPVPSDLRSVSESDVFFVNGLNLEQWISSLVENVSDTPIVELTEEVEPIEVSEGVHDPHAWLDPDNVKLYVDKTVEHLTKIDPENAPTYVSNAAIYKEKLDILDENIQAQTESVPEDQRTVVLSENAFVYFGDAYGYETAGIWELNSHSEGTPRQVADLVDRLQTTSAPYVFLESTANPVHMESVSHDSGVPIYDQGLYTDGLPIDSSIDTYYEMMEVNARAITNALSE
ncbi:metal ABC transporter solute-binding protein, Zn/Mn family [Alkalibacillus almallahensis]|uniref:metal ABC transporter solute-binding protein, Zn/Mn family n=1 Tax=Alkalibacillus almallahensis TaxID=1379154 RepID=UPI0014232E84|nr:zinc ABC transporter substrate-binding protein [Alkalibacillus almallahensis]NIK13164.1 iron/zinc/copper transport system substrate-binding protein [Alkalibacillus almallahensis]